MSEAAGIDRDLYSVKRLEVRRRGENPYTGEPYSPKRVLVEVDHRDGEFTRENTVHYSIEGSTAVFSRNSADTESLQERHVRATAVADEVVQELPFVQAVNSLTGAVEGDDDGLRADGSGESTREELEQRLADLEKKVENIAAHNRRDTAPEGRQ